MQRPPSLTRLVVRQKTRETILMVLMHLYSNIVMFQNASLRVLESLPKIVFMRKRLKPRFPLMASRGTKTCGYKETSISIEVYGKSALCPDSCDNSFLIIQTKSVSPFNTFWSF